MWLLSAAHEIVSSILVSRLNPYKMKLLGIISVDLTQQINYWPYILYLSLEKEKMGLQLGSGSPVWRLQGNLEFTEVGDLVQYCQWVCVVPMKPVILIKTCLNETYSLVWVSRSLTHCLWRMVSNKEMLYRHCFQPYFQNKQTRKVWWLAPHFAFYYCSTETQVAVQTHL